MSSLLLKAGLLALWVALVGALGAYVVINGYVMGRSPEMVRWVLGAAIFVFALGWSTFFLAGALRILRAERRALHSDLDTEASLGPRAESN